MYALDQRVFDIGEVPVSETVSAEIFTCSLQKTSPEIAGKPSWQF
jgi:hypothetical protein